MPYNGSIENHLHNFELNPRDKSHEGHSLAKRERDLTDWYEDRSSDPRGSGGSRQNSSNTGNLVKGFRHNDQNRGNPVFDQAGNEVYRKRSSNPEEQRKEKDDMYHAQLEKNNQRRREKRAGPAHKEQVKARSNKRGRKRKAEKGKQKKESRKRKADTDK